MTLYPGQRCDDSRSGRGIYVATYSHYPKHLVYFTQQQNVGWMLKLAIDPADGLSLSGWYIAMVISRRPPPFIWASHNPHGECGMGTL